jgi:hypothetical protein
MQQSTGIYVPISKINTLRKMENNMSIHHDMSLKSIRGKIIQNVTALQQIRSQRNRNEYELRSQSIHADMSKTHRPELANIGSQAPISKYGGPQSVGADSKGFQKLPDRTRFDLPPLSLHIDLQESTDT